MGTTNWTTGTIGAGYDTVHSAIEGRVGSVSRYFDCTVNNMTSGEIYQIFKVDAGVTPINFIVNVATAEGAAVTLDIGDGGVATRYETDANLNSTGTTLTMDAGTVYTAADTIDVIASATMDAAKFTVTMVYVRSELS